jgi:hypothetical protein
MTEISAAVFHYVLLASKYKTVFSMRNCCAMAYNNAVYQVEIPPMPVLVCQCWCYWKENVVDQKSRTSVVVRIHTLNIVFVALIY